MDRDCHYVTMQECHACMMYNFLKLVEMQLEIRLQNYSYMLLPTESEGRFSTLQSTGHKI